MIPTASVVAEDAPIGVQLWPTLNPANASNFILNEVQIIRNEIGSYVRWIYEGDVETRTFKVGETVTVDGETLGQWMADSYNLVSVWPSVSYS
jgi:hypothetical protein